MPLKLSSPITDVPRIGPTKARFFEKLGIEHVRDILYTFPRRYDDFSNVTKVKDLEVGKTYTVKGKVVSVKTSWGFYGRRKTLRIFVDIEDDTGVINVTWYNLKFLAKQLQEGTELYIAGKVEPSKNKSTQFSMRSPVIEFVNKQGDQTHTGRITPVYPETHGVSSRFIRYQVKNLLPLLQALPEYIPEDIRKRHKLLEIHKAIQTTHFPENTKQLEEAQRRLRFDELFFLQLAALVRRQHLKTEPSFPLKISSKELASAINELPFKLTGAQSTAIKEVISEMKKSKPMNRLLQGDVGAGKSAIAMIATKLTLDQGYKVIYLAPTEILARQQAESFREQLGRKRVSLLIGALTSKQKRSIKQKLTKDEPVCVVGTHALLQEDVKAEDVALVIVDEQHRFGVAQRKALRQVNNKKVPHLLSMTATPIPRTLNLTVYGDLDVSILDELPKGRKPVKTKIVAPEQRDKAILHTLEELHNGKQAYVIAPLVEQSDKLEAKSAKEAYEEMKHLFPGVAVGLVHGQMPADEKESVMKNFAAGAIQLLVSTAVVEVGVNVPNATIMIIEGAERFGLAQLHQFRGRVGRGEDQSFCYLFPTSDASADSQRLQILEQTNDGFVIAEKDLKLRGPGEIYGASQSGFGDLKVASLLDYPTIKIARQEAEEILKQDPELKDYPLLKGKVDQKNLQTHFE